MMANAGDVRCETKIAFLPASKIILDDKHDNNVISETIDDEQKNADDIFCGFGSCRPTWSQRFRTVSWFTAACSASSLVTSSLNIYMNSQITSLEKHFNISSSISGFLLSCNDLGFLVTTVLLSYFTRRLHIPRGLAVTTIMYGAAGLMCTVAFLGSRDQIPGLAKDVSLDVTEDSNKHFIQMCSNETSANIDECEETTTKARPSFQISATWKNLGILILALGMIIQGMAKAPRTAFTTTYIDDNVPKTQTALYLGIVTAFGAFGPALSFALGGVFSNIYITLEDTNVSPRDPRWIGAWWIGFLLFGTLGLIVALPLLFFPKRIRARSVVDVVKEPGKKELTRSLRISRDATDFFKSMGRILTNPVYMCLVIGSGINLLAIAGFLAFLPKYLETQFSISASRANLAIGITTTICFFISAISSGYMISRLKFSALSCLKMLIGCLLVSIGVFSLGFVFGCNQPMIHTGLAVNSLSPCVEQCNCNSQNFFPVCGNDRRNYFSPCHAGCLSTDHMGFSNCSCLASNESTTAAGGLCVPDCNTFYPYMVVVFVKFTFSVLGAIPAFMVTLRSVDEVDKPVSVGINTFVNSLLGWFPAPMIFGYMIDKTCLSWKQTCTFDGACSLYDIELFRFRFHILVIGLISATIILYSTALTIAVCSKRQVFQPNSEEQLETIQEAKNELLIALDESVTSSTTSRMGK